MVKTSILRREPHTPISLTSPLVTALAPGHYRGSDLVLGLVADFGRRMGNTDIGGFEKPNGDLQAPSCQILHRRHRHIGGEPFGEG